MLLQQVQTESHVKKVVMNVSKGLRRDIDSVKATGLREVGGVDEESNVMNSDECTKEVQRVFNSIGVAEFDPRLLRELRQTEIDLMDQLEVYRKRARQWASSIPIIPTKWWSKEVPSNLSATRDCVRKNSNE